MEQLELFTTFNGHFVYDDDIYALGNGDYFRDKNEHDEYQHDATVHYYRDTGEHETCFECGLSYADTVEYQEREEE